MKLVWVVIPLVLFGIIGIQDTEARCVGPYPCYPPLSYDSVRHYNDYSDVIVSGTL
ncbi:MAG: hypothetical protein HRU07_00130 [Nitrosopumilus sp.]|nr:hypothetical protein [Nitrosopumilus sp.]NRA04588.1 hypothetical protein [Nitrosopumilus sp.]